eukprot:3421044-Amphidinium_carterae.1
MMIVATVVEKRVVFLLCDLMFGTSASMFGAVFDADKGKGLVRLTESLRLKVSIFNIVDMLVAAKHGAHVIQRVALDMAVMA